MNVENVKITQDVFEAAIRLGIEAGIKSFMQMQKPAYISYNLAAKTYGRDNVDFWERIGRLNRVVKGKRKVFLSSELAILNAEQVALAAEKLKN